MRRNSRGISIVGVVVALLVIGGLYLWYTRGGLKDAARNAQDRYTGDVIGKVQTKTLAQDAANKANDAVKNMEDQTNKALDQN